MTNSDGILSAAADGAQKAVRAKPAPAPRSPKTAAAHYRSDIDGLRAVAVLAVVAYHAFPTFMPGGFVGVDIFFVISGFLISSVIFEGLERKTFTFLDFYGRRIRRILPALALMLAACAVAGWFILLAGEYKELGKHIAAGAGFVSNFILWGESGYFDANADSKPLLHLWSLGIEEQFYLVWPILLVLIWRVKSAVLPMLVLVLAASFGWNIWTVMQGDMTAAFYSPLTRFWELTIGAGLAFVSVFKLTPAKLPTWLATIVSLIGAGLIAAAFALLNKTSPFPGWWALLPTLGAFCVISAGPASLVNRWVLGNPLMVAIGLISYPLYLWHWPLLSFARIIDGGETSWQVRAALVGISVVLAWLTYAIVEKPIRFGGLRTFKTLSTLTVVAIVGAVGFTGFRMEGVPDRLKRQSDVAASFAAYPHMPTHDPLCNQMFPQFAGAYCRISRQGDPQVLAVGDSHSGVYYATLARYLPNLVVANLGDSSCLPVSSDVLLMRGNCRKQYQSMIDYLAGADSLKTVYLIGYWGYLSSGGFSVDKEGWRLPAELTEERAQEFARNAEAMLTAAVKPGRRVIWFNDPPNLNFDIKTCFSVRPVQIGGNVRQACAMDRAAFEKQTKAYDDLTANILKNFPSVEVYDSRQLFCDDSLCWAVKNGQPLYYNGDHLSVLGAEMVVRNLLARYPVN